MKKNLLIAAGVTLLAVACLAILALPDATLQISSIVPYGEVGLAMTTLAADANRVYSLGDIEEYPVIASDIIYEGAAVGENASGYARPLAAGDPFLGFAEKQVDNASGAAGAKTVRVKARGRIKLAITSLAITANDRPIVYASDDDTFTLTASTNTPIGTVSRWVETGVAIVEFDAQLSSEMRVRAAADV